MVLLFSSWNISKWQEYCSLSPWIIISSSFDFSYYTLVAFNFHFNSSQNFKILDKISNRREMNLSLHSSAKMFGLGILILAMSNGFIFVILLMILLFRISIFSFTQSLNQIFDSFPS